MTDDILVNNLTYVENLNNIPSTAVPNAMGAPGFLISLSNMFTADLNLNGNYFKSNYFFQGLGISLPVPTTYDEFIAAYCSYTGISTTSFVTNQPWLSSFLTDWSIANHDPYAASIFGPGVSVTPWLTYFSDNSAPLDVSPNRDWPIEVPSATDLISQFKNWFANFLATFPKNQNGSLVTQGDDITSTKSTNKFIDQMFAQLTTIVSLTADKAGLTYTGSVGQTLSINPPLTSYQDVYNTLFPGAGTAAFNARLQTFYDEQIEADGFFMTSQAFSVWTTEMQSDYLKVINQSGNFITLDSSLAGSGFKKTLILDRIFMLVAKLLESLQRVTAVQAQRLTILTNWQAAYTKNIAQLPIFLAAQTPMNRLSDASPGEGNPEQKRPVRDEINSVVNPNIKALMDTRRNTVADTAKGLQSSINQSSDAVSQQANVATAIIQQLATLLSAIFR